MNQQEPMDQQEPAYEAPLVEALDVSQGPAETAAGISPPG